MMQCTFFAAGVPACGMLLFAVSSVHAGGEPPFVVNTFTTAMQIQPATAALDDGGFVIVWSSQNQDGFGLGVIARVFDGDGTPRGTDFQVNEFTTGYQLLPAVAAIDDGFVVAWQSGPSLFCCTQDGDLFGVYARSFGLDGAPASEEIQVNTYTTGSQANPSVTRLGDGFVVLWDSAGQDGDGSGVFGRRFDRRARALGDELRVSEATAGEQYGPSVASVSDGGFVVAWSDDSRPTGGRLDVRARAFTASGAGDAEIVVDPNAGADQRRPRVAAGPEAAAIVWSRPDRDDVGVALRLFEPTLEPRSAVARINRFDVNRQLLTDASSAKHGFVLVWNSLGQDGDNESVVARRVDVDGRVAGPELLVNAFTPGEQSGGTVAILADGSFVVAWTSVGDGDQYGILARRFSAGEGLAVCGDGDASGAISAVDALVALSAATGSSTCALRLCDVDGDGDIAADDALLVLRVAVGLDVMLACATASALQARPR